MNYTFYYFFYDYYRKSTINNYEKSFNNKFPERRKKIKKNKNAKQENRKRLVGHHIDYYKFYNLFP